jgi:hypothetical protein
MAVDEGHGVMSHIQADFADQRDSTLLPSIVAPLQPRLLAQELPVRKVAADTNYSNGVNYALLEAQVITPWIPVFGRYKPEIEGFTYDQATDALSAQRASNWPLSVSTPTRMAGSPSATVPPAAIVDVARASPPVFPRV